MDPKEKMHEFMPALCFAMGLIFIVGALFIGPGHAFTVGYATIGITCMTASVYMAGVLRKVRAIKVSSRRR